jgi:hypothetical protein
MDVEPPTPVQRANIPGPSAAPQRKKTVLEQNTEALLQMIHKYNKIDIFPLFQQIKTTNNEEDHDSLMQLYRHRDWNRIYRQAITEYNMGIKLDDRKYGDILLGFVNDPIETDSMLFVTDTKDLFLNWCVNQRR